MLGTVARLLFGIVKKQQEFYKLSSISHDSKPNKNCIPLHNACITVDPLDGSSICASIHKVINQEVKALNGYPCSN